ncbi:YwiC-like family protein [Streptomyces filamentosus]|uniref:YwiC-like family protein n=1 Tax=Streptomyces filamentosus TaxID=67294 RepID=UPI0037D0E8AC
MSGRRGQRPRGPGPDACAAPGIVPAPGVRPGIVTAPAPATVSAARRPEATQAATPSRWVRLRRASRNPRAAARHHRPALAFATAVLALGLPLLAAAPWLLVAAALMAPFLAVNVLHARRNRERALVNGLAAVVPACGMLLVAHRAGGGTLAEELAPALACLLYFAGTVPYGKTMIRERRSEAYRRGSVAHHAAALVAAALLDPWLAVPSACYLARAAALLGRGLKVAVVGAAEVGCSVLLLGFLVALHG